ncbi:MAG TPA: adenylate/guanylate cyclase domain-containing protein [Candidatus Limnocylindrales bacterium]|nr:adenylate/guanylate cyclase domain-containing protein [Candidatus Limnocylindrales bacterium]
MAERRLVSVLFADLVGFTTLSEGRDAEDTRELLSRYFEVARETLGRYGGTVEKFIGDAVMAVWGTPTAHEDDAERAVRAALDLLDEVRGLSPDLQARAGILTGEAAVTLGATGQGMVAGDLVNTASRLQSIAPPGAVLVDEATRRAAGKAVAFEAAGEHALRGKEAAIVAYRALRVVAERGGRGRADRLEAPFVGRDPELRLLKEFFHATGRERRPRLVSIIGLAGVGKSRLAWELEKYIDGIVEQVLSNNGRSPAYGEGVTFWALGEIVRQRTGLVEGDDEATTRARIAETLDLRVPDAAERRTIEPALLALLGLEPSPPGGRDELFAAWRLFLERGAAGRTMVITFEDLQWADPGLLDFIDHLLEWSRGVPLMVIALSRPELLERRPGWGAGRRNSVTLSLEPLPEEQMRRLLEGLVPGLPEAAVRRIVERADGIPLYAVETVRMLVAEGRLVEDAVGYRPVGDLSDLAVPETLQALIASRLDSLEAADRSLLQDAAILGQSFSRQALAAVSPLPDEDLDPALERLVRREVLTRVDDSSSPERGQYAFVQALIREVAYGTLARRDRRSKHLAAARYFESLGDDELAGALAAHYLAAYQETAAGPEADALAGQARLALRGAGERAVALGSHGQAKTFYEQALGVTQDPAERGELLERAGEAAAADDQMEAAIEHLRAATAAARERGDRSAAARTAAEVGQALITANRSAEALPLLEAATDEFADLGADPGAALIGSQLARASFFLEQHRRAVEIADRVLEIAEHGAMTPLLADTLITKGSALANLGRLEEGLALIRAGSALAEQQGLFATAARGIINQAATAGDADPRAALAAARHGLELAQRLGLRSLLAVLVTNAASSAVSTGEWDWAIETLAAAPTDLDRLHSANLASATVSFMIYRGEDVTEPMAAIQRLLEGSTEPATRAGLLDLGADVAFHRGDWAQAYELWLEEAREQALAAAYALSSACRAALMGGDVERARTALEAHRARGLHGPALEATRQRLGAGLAALEGRTQEATVTYRETLRAWRDLGLPWYQALTVLDMAELLAEPPAEMEQLAGAAREIMVGLGARPYIERLDAAMGRQARPGPTAASLSVDAIPGGVSAG